MPAMIFVGLVVVLIVWLIISSVRGDAKLRKQPVTRTIDCKVSGRQVKLVGKVKAIQLVHSPGTNRECVGYRVHARYGNRSATKTLVASFILDDGRGEVIVDCGSREEGMLSLLLDNDVTESRILSSISVAEAPGIASLGFQKVEHLNEAVLMPHDRVAVFGEVQRSGTVVKIVRPERGIFMATTQEKYFGER
jgi:hypothetical protein